MRIVSYAQNPLGTLHRSFPEDGEVEVANLL